MTIILYGISNCDTVKKARAVGEDEQHANFQRNQAAI